MTSQCGPRRPNLNETKMRRRYDIACPVRRVFRCRLSRVYTDFYINCFYIIS